MDNVLYGGRLRTRIEPRLSLGEYLAGCLIGNRDNLALIEATTGAKKTHRSLYEDSCNLATKLQKLGVESGDRVAICSENRSEYLAAILASIFVGAAVVPLNPVYTIGELEHCSKISTPRAFFCSSLTLDKVCELSQKVDFIKDIVDFDCGKVAAKIRPRCGILNFSALTLPSKETFRAPKIDPESHPAVILSSSGTTGLPKGVQLTHENIKYFLGTMKDEYFVIVKEGEVALGLVPFFHGYGFGINLVVVSNCTTLVILPRFEENLFLSAIQDYKVTSVPVAPPLLNFFAKHPLVDEYDLSCIQNILSGGAPASSEILKRVAEKFNLPGIHQGYGMTESTIIATYCRSELKNFSSVGKLVPEMFGKVIDPETGVALPKNQSGELCLKGPMIMQKYRNNEAVTKETVDSEGWLHTGDVAYYDEQNLFYVIDRLKELIKYKAYQVAPAELEAIILPYPGIIDVAVVGIPHGVDGEHPAAFIVKHPAFETTPEEIQQFVSDQVSPQKRLRGGVFFVHAIPKNSNGKIMRKVIKEKYCQKAKF